MADAEPGQFDDAPEVDARAGYTYVDEASSKIDKSWLEYSEDEEDDEEIVEDGYDDGRVEDEDWEIAERGQFRRAQGFLH